MHPQMYLHGRVDRTALPWSSTCATGTEADFDLLDSLDRRRRDAAHGPDHAVLFAQNRLIVVDRPAGSGYAYLAPSGEPAVVCATNRRSAARCCGRPSPPPRRAATYRSRTSPRPTSGPSTSAWRAACRSHTAGYLAVRGMKPPAPYLHHGALL